MITVILQAVLSGSMIAIVCIALRLLIQSRENRTIRVTEKNAETLTKALEQAADAELYTVDPQLAIELGYEPPKPTYNRRRIMMGGEEVDEESIYPGKMIFLDSKEDPKDYLPILDPKHYD